jgi:hypothetical protein
VILKYHNAGCNSSVMANTRINGRLPALRLALYPTGTVSS